MLLPVLTSSVCNCSPELSSDDDDSDEPLSVKEATQPLKKENKRLFDELETLKAQLKVLLFVLIVSNPLGNQKESSGTDKLKEDLWGQKGTNQEAVNQETH
jgi:hypothetical protein